LIFVAFTGEEYGLIGSKYFVENMETDSIIAVINIEMIGRSDQSNPRPFVTGHDKSDLIKILNRNYYQSKNNSEKNYFKPDPYKESFLFIRSDNYPFALKAVPAHCIMLTSTFDEFYHNLNDEPLTLNYTIMKKVIQSIAIAAKGLVSGTDSPKRIAKEDLGF
jgi:Zn-dependent M28 family amino/carboxypeptidase